MAMSYEQARDRALFLTDKMAYELNLNDEQYEAAYEVNLDYLMSINTYDDLYGTYWTRRNLDLSYILFDWQYNAFCSAAYFYRPLSWTNGVWRFSIYARYPNRTYFYFGRPAFYATYYGGHSWHMNGGRSWYHGRSFGPRPGESRFGMRDRFDRGDFRGPRNDNRRYDRNDRRDNRNNNGRYDQNNRRDDRNNNGRYDQSNRRDDRNNSGSEQNNRRNDRNNNSGYRGRSDNYSSNQSSTRTTVQRGVSSDMTRANNRGMSSRNVQTETRSRNSQSSVSRSSGSPSRAASTFSPSSRGGSNSGGGRSGGGGHFGGRR